MSNRWSKEEQRILFNNYNKSIEELMQLLPQRTKKAIRIKMDKVNLTKKKSQYKPRNKNKDVPKPAKIRENWTKEEVEILLQCDSLEEALEKLPHYSERRITNKMYKMRRTFCDRVWSKKEEQILYDYYELGKLDTIIELLPNRTEIAIKAKANKLNLKYPLGLNIDIDLIIKMYKEGMYPTEIARILNVSPTTIANKLMKNYNYKRVILKGERHPQWQGKSSEIATSRRSEEYYQWRNSVFNRDSYTCQCCGDSKSGTLEAHHIKSFAKHTDKRFDTDNGLTLCKNCHNVSIKGSFHNTYGTRSNTSEQLQEYIDKKRNELNLDKFSLVEYLSIKKEKGRCFYG